jgi:hypothetical protein
VQSESDNAVLLVYPVSAAGVSAEPVATWALPAEVRSIAPERHALTSSGVGAQKLVNNMRCGLLAQRSAVIAVGEGGLVYVRFLDHFDSPASIYMCSFAL